MDTSNSGSTTRKSYLTGALIASVAISFFFFLGVSYYYWVRQPEPSAIFDVQADAYYDHAEIVIETPGQPTLRQILKTADASKTRFILNPGVVSITVSRDDQVLYYREIEIRSGPSILNLKQPVTQSSN